MTATHLRSVDRLPLFGRHLDGGRSVVRGMVQNLAVTRYDGAMGDRPVPGLEDFPERDVTPLAGLRAARFVVENAEQAVREYIAAARGDGMSWREIARACGLTAAGGDASVFAAAAGTVYGHITYRCRTCGDLIDDYGPEAGTPVEAIDGHLTDCPHRPL